MTDKLPAQADTPADAPAVPRQKNQPAIVEFISAREFQIAEMLPAHLTVERFVRLVYTEMRKNPDLMRCTPESVVGGMLTAAALGLEIGGALGESYLLPFDSKFYNPETKRDEKRMEAEFVPGYKGIAKLFWQHPLAARLSAEYVCERDEFEYDKGLRPFLRHRAAEGDRGPVVAFYAIVGLSGREPWFDVFTPDQIKALRGGKVGTKGRIADPERWMERKTALLQVLKLAPKATSLVSAISVDQRSGHDLWASGAPAAINSGQPVPELAYATPQAAGDTIDAVTGEVLDGQAAR